MDTFRDARLAGFIALLKTEGRRAVLGLACGQGTDGLRFVQDGIHYTGVDPSEENVRAARVRGLEASVAEGAALPFAAAAFPAVWAVDALVGLPADLCGEIIRELERVTRPGAPIAVVLPDPVAGHSRAGEEVLGGHDGPAAAAITVLRSPDPQAGRSPAT